MSFNWPSNLQHIINIDLLSNVFQTSNFDLEGVLDSQLACQGEKQLQQENDYEIRNKTYKNLH